MCDIVFNMKELEWIILTQVCKARTVIRNAVKPRKAGLHLLDLRIGNRGPKTGLIASEVFGLDAITKPNVGWGSDPRKEKL